MRDDNRIWIGPDDRLEVGQIGFLIERSNTLQGWRRHSLQTLPAHTNQSRQPRLVGWCGTTNDVAVHAHGLAQVVRLAENGRALVQLLADDELRPALEALGYPELWEGQS